MNCIFKVGKTYKTIDSADVLIIAVDTHLAFPVVGILTAENGIKKVFSWTIDGLGHEPWTINLVKPKPIVKTLWINVYKLTNQKNDEKDIYMNYDIGVHSSKEEALDYISLLNLMGKPLYIGTFPFSFEVSDE